MGPDHTDVGTSYTYNVRSDGSGATCPAASGGWETVKPFQAASTAYGLSIACNDTRARAFCCACENVRVSGLEKHQSASMATYAYLPGVTHGTASHWAETGRPIFYSASAAKYLYFGGSDWRIGDDYTSSSINAQSNGGTVARCPSDSSGWSQLASVSVPQSELAISTSFWECGDPIASCDLKEAACTKCMGGTSYVDADFTCSTLNSVGTYNCTYGGQSHLGVVTDANPYTSWDSSVGASFSCARTAPPSPSPPPPSPSAPFDVAAAGSFAFECLSDDPGDDGDSLPTDVLTVIIAASLVGLVVVVIFLVLCRKKNGQTSRGGKVGSAGKTVAAGGGSRQWVVELTVRP